MHVITDLFLGDPPWLPWILQAICCETDAGIFCWQLSVLMPILGRPKL